MATITLHDITHRYGDATILDGVSLTVDDGELCVVVGPSGSGKTTLLRVIAGLVTPQSGSVWFDGVDMTRSPPRDRDLAMVFQQSTLFPTRTVRKNIGFGLEVRGVAREEIDLRVEAEARVLAIEQTLERYPGKLSAGQRRLADVARAIVRTSPAVLLMDEPLATLDAHARERLRREIRLLQRGLRITTVYVTNDAVEAMSLADTVVVIEGGTVRQSGTPADLYRRPASVFVASVLGRIPMNLVAAMVEHRPERRVIVAGHSLPAWSSELEDRTAVLAGFRPEDVEISGAHAGGVDGRVATVEYLGDRYLVTVRLPGGETLAGFSHESIPPGSPATVGFSAHGMHLFDAVTGEALAHPLGK